ncbi:MAG: ROK family protein [Candidatus Tectomicrobia bacterium]|nr:ROK family protein [Candidatus Tectomicrobia bacterium]
MEILGIDVGASGIKGAPVDTRSGEMTASRIRVPTPEGATPEAVSEVVGQLVSRFRWSGPVGCGFPAAVRQGRVLTAVNIADHWVGESVTRLFQEAAGRPVTVINDADAAGLAEMRFGAGRGRAGLVMILTLGTGIGTSLFIDGRLVPNTELGQVEFRGSPAEKRAAAIVRQRQGLSWAKWARRLDDYLHRMEYYFWPDLMILGGGVSKKSEKFLPLLTLQTEVVAAQMLNNAGIVGAALAALPQGQAQRDVVGAARMPARGFDFQGGDSGARPEGNC